MMYKTLYLNDLEFDYTTFHRDEMTHCPELKNGPIKPMYLLSIIFRRNSNKIQINPT